MKKPKDIRSAYFNCSVQLDDFELVAAADIFALRYLTPKKARSLAKWLISFADWAESEK